MFYRHILLNLHYSHESELKIASPAQLNDPSLIVTCMLRVDPPSSERRNSRQLSRSWLTSTGEAPDKGFLWDHSLIRLLPSLDRCSDKKEDTAVEFEPWGYKSPSPGHHPFTHHWTWGPWWSWRRRATERSIEENSGRALILITWAAPETEPQELKSPRNCRAP